LLKHVCSRVQAALFLQRTEKGKNMFWEYKEKLFLQHTIWLALTQKGK
jgi:hypothetical protein